MDNNKQMEIIISIKDQFTKGLKDMGKSFNRVIEEIKELNKGVFKANEMVVVQLEKMNKGFQKTDKVVKKTKVLFDRMGKAVGNVKDRIKKLTGEVFSFKGALTGVGLGLIGGSFIGAANKAEQLRLRLAALLGSTEEADTVFTNTAKYATTVALEFEHLAESATNLSGIMTGGSKEIAKWIPILSDLKTVSGLALQETTSNFVRMYSAGAAAADLFREKGILGLLEFIPKVEYTAKQTQEKIVHAYEKATSRFRDSSKDLAGTWEGMVGMMKDHWFLFRIAVMESGVYNYMKAALSLVIDKINELRDSGDLGKWAEKMSAEVIEGFQSMAFGVASVYDVMAPILKTFWELFIGAWDWFKQLPEEIQKVGLVGFMLAGSVGTKVLVATIMDLYGRLDKMQKDIQSGIDPIKARDLREEIERLKESLKDMPDWSNFGVASEFSRTTEEIKKLEVELETLIGKKIGSVVDIEETEKDAQSMVSILIDAFKLIAKRKKEIDEKPKKVGFKLEMPEKTVSLIDEMKSALNRHLIDTEVYLTDLEISYEEGIKTFSQYWDARKAKLDESYQLEIAVLKQIANAETEDPTKKLAAMDKVYTKEKQYAQARMALLAEETQAEKNLVDKKKEFYNFLFEIKKRLLEAEATSLKEKHDLELEDLDRHHKKELDKIKKQTDDIITEEERRQLLLKIAKGQEVERDKKVAEQKKAIMEQQLKNARTIAEGMKGIATELYEMSGKNNKKMFRIAKVAAIAQAIVNGALAVSKANDGTYMGYAKMAIAAAMAGIQVAKIRQTEMGGSFAEGGEIPGHSPHSKSDNIKINATAGEYMQPVSAVKYYGKRVMDGIRSRAFPPELFSGFTTPSASYANGGGINFAEGGSIQSLTKVAQNAPKIEIINVSDPEVIKGLAMASVHENRDIVVNMVLQEMDEKKITLQRDY